LRVILTDITLEHQEDGPLLQLARLALIVAEFGRCGGPMGVVERHTCLVLRLAKGRSEGLACGGRPRGHLDDGKRQIARTMYEAVDAERKRPDAVADLARHLWVSRPSRAAGDRLGCSHQLALGVAFQPWDSRSV
jgi:hypothetical protein